MPAGQVPPGGGGASPPPRLGSVFVCAEPGWQLVEGHQGEKAERTRPGHLALNNLLVSAPPPVAV